MLFDAMGSGVFTLIGIQKGMLIGLYFIVCILVQYLGFTHNTAYLATIILSFNYLLFACIGRTL